MQTEFPEVFEIIGKTLLEQYKEGTNAKYELKHCKEIYRHPHIQYNNRLFMKFGQYGINEEAVFFYVFVIEKKVGILKFTHNKLYFIYDNNQEEREFNIALLDEIYDEIIVKYYKLDFIYNKENN